MLIYNELNEFTQDHITSRHLNRVICAKSVYDFNKLMSDKLFIPQLKEMR